MDTQYIDQELNDLHTKLEEVKELILKAEAIQSDLSDTAAKELTVFNDESLSNEDKTKRLIELRTYGEVVKASLLKANAALYAAEDLVISAGINANNSLCGFRDALRSAALREAVAIADEVFLLAKGESEHWGARARKVHTLDRIEALSFVGNNRPNSLRNIPKLRHIYNQLKSLA
jgi:hypothetical protein